MTIRNLKCPPYFYPYSLTLASILAGCGSGETDLGTHLLPPESSVWPPHEPNDEGGDDPTENPWVSGFEQEPGASDPLEPFAPDDVATDPDSALGNTTQVLDLGSPGPTPTPPFLVRRFEQYAEGKGSDKMLVISGELGTSQYPCTVEMYSNGGTTPWRRFPLPDTFPEEGTISLCTATMVYASCSHEMTGSVFNGNDALVIRCEATLMDSFGRVGEDPGVAWIGTMNAQVRSEGQHLVRCGSGSERDTDPSDYFDVSAHWVKREVSEAPADARSRCPAPPADDPQIGFGGAQSHPG